MLSIYNKTTSSHKYQKLKNLKDMTNVVAFLQENNIDDLDSFYDKIVELNKSFYTLSGEIKKVETRISEIEKRFELWE